MTEFRELGPAPEMDEADELTRAAKKTDSKKKKKTGSSSSSSKKKKKTTSSSLRLTKKEKALVQNYRKGNELEKQILEALAEKFAEDLNAEGILSVVQNLFK